MLRKRCNNLVENHQSSQKTASVKICGLTSLEMIQSIMQLPVDQIGFVFAPSKRQVTPGLAGKMIALLHDCDLRESQKPETVGVFVHPTKQELIDTVALAPIDVIQLHGEETVDDCRWIKNNFQLKIFKTVSVSESNDMQQQLAHLQPYVGYIDAILLDTFDPLLGGGTGVKFAWHCIPDYLNWAHHVGLKLIVAGGLNADNVSQLIADYQPDGVDVSSGVETNGFKDAGKIKSFVERVKGI
jgi:phosphoribosylanthranilate isomerase